MFATTVNAHVCPLFVSLLDKLSMASSAKILDSLVAAEDEARDHWKSLGTPVLPPGKKNVKYLPPAELADRRQLQQQIREAKAAYAKAPQSSFRQAK